MAKDDERDEQVRDHGTTQMSGDEVANAAAETLHGNKAQPEQHEQPDVTVLPAGGTLVSDRPDEAQDER